MFQRQPEVTIAQLAAASGYDSFGGWITAMKKKYSLTQDGIARAARRYFEAASIKPLPSQAAIGRLERNDPDRYPRFRELEPFYRAFVERGGLNLPLSVEERELYLYFARKRIEERQRKERLSEEQWQTLADRLLVLTPNPKSRFHLVRPTEQRRTVQERPLPVQEEDPNSRRKRAIQGAKDTDLRLFLEREEWVEHMLRYPEMKPQMKLVVVQGGAGTGKSYATAFLLQHLDKHENYFLIPYLFEAGESKTQDDYLEEFLSTILADLTFAQVGDESKQRPLETRIDDFFVELHKRAEKQQKVIFVLDNAHLIFPNAGAWSAAWSTFLERFARDSHSATMYVMTRTWPGWDHPLPFVERTDLPALSLAAAVSIWHHFGFRDVPQDVLEKISVRCGCNPQLIELLVAQCQKSTFGVRWGRTATAVSTSAQSPNTQKLETLLAQDSIFGARVDTKTRTVLQSAVSGQLSHQAKAMLECLACSPLGLPFCLLADEFVGVEDAFNDLANASLIDLSLAASQRAIIAPFAREAVLLSLANDGRRDAIESRVTDLYAYWLQEVRDFKDDREKAALVAEMIVRYIRAGQMIKAAELIIQFGWLCALFGQIARIRRVFDEIVDANKGKDLGEAYGAGRILFSYNLQLLFGESVDVRARDRDFHVVRDLALTGKITLRPRTEISIAHYLMQKMTYEKRYQEADDFLQGTFDRIAANGEVLPEVEASFLHSKSTLLGRWSAYAVEMKQPQEVARLRRECVGALTAGIRLWRKCLFDALPIQEYNLKRKIGDGLQDLAYYLRIVGRIDEAEQAILECLELKEEEKAGLPGDLAVAIGEYAKILAVQGRYKEAGEKSADAIKRIEEVAKLSDSVKSNLGMLLIERAQIYEMQGRLDEAYELAKQGIPLLKPNRRLYKMEAEELCAHIRAIRESPIRYHLDSQWFAEYHSLAQYNDVGTLAQAGPFTPEEARLWSELFPNYREPVAWEQLARIVRQSRSREFELSLKENRLPILLYPAIDPEDVNKRVQGFSALQSRIEHEEKNSVVRRLYVRKIEEHLLHLRLIAATHGHDIDTIRVCNEALYGRIGQAEMAVALQKLFVMLKRAEEHPQASEMAKTVLKQLEQWKLVAADFLHGQEAIEEGDSAKLKLWSETSVSAPTVQQFFKQVMSEYGFTEWRVIPSPDKNSFELDLDRCILYIPTEKEFSVLTVAELLAEEIETHMFRSTSGQRSKLALLGTGTRGYLVCEEGLAKFMVQEMWTAQGLGQKSNTWITTLALGLVQGILVPSHSYETLQEFLYRVMLTGQLEKGKIEGAERVARGMAFRRTTRTFIGVPESMVAGVCDMRDRAYLQGHREVSELLTRYPLERLLVGSISTDDLDDMEELHILSPSLKHRRLACQPDLFERIVGLEK